MGRRISYHNGQPSIVRFCRKGNRGAGAVRHRDAVREELQHRIQLIRYGYLLHVLKLPGGKFLGQLHLDVPGQQGIPRLGCFAGTQALLCKGLFHRNGGRARYAPSVAVLSSGAEIIHQGH